MASLPNWIFAILVIGAIAYVYFAGGADDYAENYTIAFVTLMLGIIMGGIFL